MAARESKAMDRNSKLVADSLTKLAHPANIFDDAEAENMEELISDYFLVEDEEESPAEEGEATELAPIRPHVGLATPSQRTLSVVSVVLGPDAVFWKANYA